MNILFVCKHNRFRSKVAGAYFNKVNKNKKIKAKSAGIFRGTYPLDKTQTAIAKKLGIKLTGRPETISIDLLKWQDLVIIVANDVPKSLFNYKHFNNKIILWEIADEYEGNKQNTKKIIKTIMKKIDRLTKRYSKRC